MEHKKRETKEVEVVSDITCDCCGHSCSKPYGQVATLDDNFEYMKLEARWGYDSKKDMESWDAHICETCVDNYLVPLIKFRKRQIEFSSCLHISDQEIK